MKDCCPTTHMCIYFEECIFIIQANFLKDYGTLFIILILFFQYSLLCRDIDGKRIYPYLLSKLFRPYFGRYEG